MTMIDRTTRLSGLARDGDLDGILELAGADPAGDPDIVAYHWLTVASDFGHEEADDLIDDLLESSSLRYDDDNAVTGHVHFELAVAYLTGTDGLPVDHDLGRRHVAEMRELNFPATIQEGDTLVADARAAMDPKARAAWDEAIAG
jgi:hypothetical protein